MEVVQLRLQRTPEQRSLDAGERRGGHTGLADPVQNSGDCGEGVRLEDRHIFEQDERVAGPVAQAAAARDNAELAHTLLV